MADKKPVLSICPLSLKVTKFEKIVYLLIKLFQYCSDRAISSKVRNVICDHLSILVQVADY